jgi:hypothetical protein
MPFPKTEPALLRVFYLPGLRARLSGQTRGVRREAAGSSMGLVRAVSTQTSFLGPILVSSHREDE